MNIKYLYVRNEYKKRDVTVVSNLFDEDGKTFIKFAWSFRHKNDQFIKREGRRVALERLQNNDPNYSAMVQVEPEKVKFFDLAVEILESIANSPYTPKVYKRDIAEDMQYYLFRTEENQNRLSERWKLFRDKGQLV